MFTVIATLPDYYYERLLNLTDEYSPLKRVMPHVAHKQLDRAFSVSPMGTPDQKVVLEAEKEICRLYVTEDFCGLCGRYTDHRGEH